MPARRPVRPNRCENEATVAGASTWITRSGSPTSISSSNVLVATITQSLPCANASSERRRSSKLSELCETNVPVPNCRRPAASSSTRARLSQKTRRFSPLWSEGDDPRRVLDATHIVQLHGSRLHRLAVRCDDAPGPRRGVPRGSLWPPRRPPQFLSSSQQRFGTQRRSTALVKQGAPRRCRVPGRVPRGRPGPRTGAGTSSYGRPCAHAARSGPDRPPNRPQSAPGRVQQRRVRLLGCSFPWVIAQRVIGLAWR